MRKEYNFSEGTRGRFRARGPRRQGAASVGRTGRSKPLDEELTTAQVRELRRRMADLDNATRYMLVSQMGPRFALYYNLSEDVYVLNDPRGATLFKRRNAALAVKALLGGSIRVVRCGSKRVSGVRVPVQSTTRRRRRVTARRLSSNHGLRLTARREAPR